MGKLDGKIAIVTGASSGMGRAAALRFAAEGAKVVVGARSEDKLKNLVEEIQAGGGEAIFVIADVTKEEDNKALVDAAVSTYGGLHVAFNNAGAYDSKTLTESTLEHFDLMMSTNVKSAMWALKFQIPAMSASGDKGSIVINSSATGSSPTSRFGGASIYAASKAAVDMLVKYAAVEAAESNVRVNAVAPGIVRTGMTEGFGDMLNTMAAGMQLIKRPGTPDEIANMVVLLASDDGSFITGSVQVVDGGWSIAG